MKVDVRGNLYSTGEGGVWILSPMGKHIGTILTGERPTNVAFGGDDAKTLYITGASFIAQIKLLTAGKR